MVAGALWAGIAGLLRVTRGVSEVISTIMLNAIDQGRRRSWHEGAMDNGSANATMLEVARLLASRKSDLYRGVRVMFWSGHSHGRYSGSTWYVDNHWEELHERCVAHVNVDSTGARGATYYGSFPAHAELRRVRRRARAGHTGQQAQPKRMSRAGDMSFNGAGIPAMFMSLSQVPVTPENTDGVSASFSRMLGGKMPWWWHTSEDTIDKVDLDVLQLDTQVYVSTLWRLCHVPLLPMDFRPVIADLRAELVALQHAVGQHCLIWVPRSRAPLSLPPRSRGWPSSQAGPRPHTKFRP